MINFSLLLLWQFVWLVLWIVIGACGSFGTLGCRLVVLFPSPRNCKLQSDIFVLSSLRPLCLCWWMDHVHSSTFFSVIFKRMFLFSVSIKFGDSDTTHDEVSCINSFTPNHFFIDNLPLLTLFS